MIYTNRIALSNGFDLNVIDPQAFFNVFELMRACVCVSMGVCTCCRDLVRA